MTDQTAELLRVCIICKQAKPATEFYKHRADKPKRSSRCRVCDQARKRNPAFRAHHRSYMAGRRKLGLPRPWDTEHARRYREKYPEKTRAKQLVRAAIIAGKLMRPIDCQACGAHDPRRADGRPLIQAHHDDYSKPLEVRWLCAICHANEHNRSTLPPTSKA